MSKLPSRGKRRANSDDHNERVGQCIAKAVPPAAHRRCVLIVQSLESTIMKPKLIAAAALLALSIGAPAFAFAQTSAGGLTRAQVIADLAQAERDGTVPAPNWDYPPSAQTIERNRELYAIAHGERDVVVTHAPTSTPSEQ
jgi:hypothetical protein